MDIASLLDRSGFLQGMGEKSRRSLAAICVERQAVRKEILFFEGEHGEALYLLASGSVSLFKTTADGKEVVIKVVRPGEIFAEVILFEQDIYPVSATAKTACRVFLLPRRQFYALLDDAAFRDDFIGMLMRKQRYLADRIRFLTTHDVEDRFFIFLREQFGENERIVPPLSNKDMAAAIGVTPETYSRLLARLSGEGKIVMVGKTIRLQKGFWKSRNVPG
ncbi:MAG: Crp/Fnr family transcriptional regulator [Acidobacteria bacterium]|nr:Crp/Fnr family transcriptional regulator [Acidobacteriota bacterium]